MPHTPGPWTISDGSIHDKVITVTGSADDYFINLHCEIDRDDKDGETAEANARLIAAAPELFASLREVMSISANEEAYWRADALIERLINITK